MRSERCGIKSAGFTQLTILTCKSAQSLAADLVSWIKARIKRRSSPYSALSIVFIVRGLWQNCTQMLQCAAAAPPYTDERLKAELFHHCHLLVQPLNIRMNGQAGRVANNEIILFLRLVSIRLIGFRSGLDGGCWNERKRYAKSYWQLKPLSSVIWLIKNAHGAKRALVFNLETDARAS
jgi:hypothetical protein